MSGTSVDAVDSALLRCAGNHFELLATREHPIPAKLKQRVASISHSGEGEIERMGVLDRDLGSLFAEATRQLLTSASVKAAQITAIGSHGQTIRHRPPSSASRASDSFTLQIGDPNTIAEQTGITTVADFRRRDMAAGGEGAPLAPAFHAWAFTKEGVNRAIVNIGGIANATLLAGNELHAGFDTGPGNTLMDHWISRHRDANYDQDGQWAASGKVADDLLQSLLSHPYFNKTGPRSTGKEAFNLAWLEGRIGATQLTPEDIQATLLELTASSIATALRQSVIDIKEVYICGGGAHNLALMSRLAQLLEPATVASTTQIGMDPDWVEAATFAWLASRTMNSLAGNAPVVTGAAGLRVLGAIYPAG